MTQRQLSRAQGLLRGFFGLGPAQFSMTDNIVPVLDTDFLQRSNQDCQLLVLSSGAVTPGNAGSISITPPSPGTWLLHALSIDSLGPATSGNWRFCAWIAHSAAAWGLASNVGLFDQYPSIPRAGNGRNVFGRYWNKSIVFHRVGIGVSDTLEATVFNEAGSVGNLTVTMSALVRQVDSAVNK
jgi:hypothetical protein